MEKWLKYLVGISAVIIAGCAAFFSITGLGILFAGASISVMVMAGSLEYAKLVTATYLKLKWGTIKGFNKWYLTAAVIILMAITSAGIFGYLSNAFQQQNIKLEQVAREIGVWQNKIDFSNQQIATLQSQQKDLTTTQNTLLSKGNVNSRLIKSADNRDKQSTSISKKINSLQDSIVAYNGHINDIKNNNISIEREVGGFRFVAEAFGMTLNNVVKFFIFLIVIVFDPLAIALVIAFNQIVLDEKEDGIDAIIDDGGISEYIKKKKDDDVKEIIEEESRLKLSENDIKKLEEILLNPPPPNDNLKKGAEEYNQKVKQKPWSNLPDDMWERIQKIEAQREATHGPILPEDEPTGALANSGPRERDEMEKEETLEQIVSLPIELIDTDEPIDENIFNEEPTIEEEEQNFSQKEDEIVEVNHNVTSIDGYTPIPFGEEFLEPIEDFGIPIDESIDNESELTFKEEQLPDDMLKVLNEVQTETFNQEPTSLIDENNERMDIIGQNGNEGLHYDNEENTSSEQDDEKKN